MYALLGEKFVKIFDEDWNSISMNYDVFLRDLQEMRQHKIILDGSKVDFSLEPLRNCNILDAYSALRCLQKVSTDAENISLLPRFNIFKKSDFYIQKSIFKCDFFEKISANTVFIMENIIAAFCHDVTEIHENTWWLYVAHHCCSGVRIVAGIGDGIVLSRVLSDTMAQNVSDSVKHTIKYLRRFGLKNTIKIICAMDDVSIENIENQEIIRIKNDAETMLLTFLATAQNVRPIRNGENYCRRILQSSHRKISILLGICIFMEIIWLIFGFFDLWKEKQIVASMAKVPEKIVQDASSVFQFKITGENFSFIEQLIKILKNSSHLARVFCAAASVIRKNKIDVEQVVLENSDSVKIRATLNRSRWHRILQSNYEGMSISLEKNLRSEFDRLDSTESSDEKIGAVICIKTK
ncbi:MAG: hypothetical protein LBB12_01305 [Holosporaceae bacterium]|jgi:hypothetical protein|nr:hypothetical protein [Holosporaceae bacterium]